MFDNQELEQIRTIIQEELTKSFSRKITVQRGARKQGDPESVIKEEEWNILDWMVFYMPYLEGAVRGMQEDTGKSVGRVTEMAKILIGMEEPIKVICQVSQVMKLAFENQKGLLHEGYSGR